jgi:hypothetical protein
MSYMQKLLLLLLNGTRTNREDKSLEVAGNETLCRLGGIVVMGSDK